MYQEYGDCYAQAKTYHSLGMMKQEQKQWKQARYCLLQALELFVKYDDAFYVPVILCNLAQFWQDSNDMELPTAIGSMLGMVEDEAEQLLRYMLDLIRGS